MKSIIITPLKTKSYDGMHLRSCEIERLDNNILIDRSTLFFSFPDKFKPPEDNDCDNYLIALIFDAMFEQRKIIVNGSVSRLLLRNIKEFQGCWTKWLPDLYSIVEINVDHVRKEKEPINSDSICAFSGGVDATFSVWRNYKQRNSVEAYKIRYCSFVHGFDIPLSDNEAFSRAYKTASETLNDINIELIPMQTNFRELSKVNWEHSHPNALISGLYNLKSIAGTCIIGSSGSYDHLVLPWGSNPITDHLLSSENFSIIHDGATHNRIEKVQEISQWKIGTNNLRVCWEGSLKDRNCGKCEKCLRTKLNFLLTENYIPECFPDYKEKVNLKGIRTWNKGCNSDWISIYDYAKQNGADKKLLSQIKKVIQKRISIKDIPLLNGVRGKKIKKRIKRVIKIFKKLINKK